MKKRIVYLILFIIFLLCCNSKKEDRTRKTAVAGTFYPGEKKELRKMITDFFSNVNIKKNDKKIKALISPHAGYIYSGPIAASGYSLIKNGLYKKIFLIGPSHHYYLNKPSVLDLDYYKTPLGKMKIWSRISNFIKKNNFQYIPKAHEKEHSLEVQIPFLQEVAAGCQIIPILIGSENIDKLKDAIIDEYDSDTLIVVSSDFSHYHSYNEANKLDKSCVDTIINNDIDNIDDKEACGINPIKVLMEIARHFNWDAQLLDLRNSGDTAGSKDKVVGYASIAFYEGDKSKKNHSNEELNEIEKSFLLDLALKVIKKKSKKINIDKNKITAKLREKRGCFVTLNKDHKLRGCIGYILPVKPLYETVIDNAYNAAFSDYRFNPVEVDEIKSLEIEISVLTVPRKIQFKDSKELLQKIIPGDDGIIIKRDGRSATYLPQVWEQIPDTVSFLNHLCQKAGLSDDAWKKNGIIVEKYSVYSFTDTD